MSVTTLPREKIAAPVVRPAGRELELKFLVSEPAFRASQNWPALPPSSARRATRLRSFYYDTPSGALHQHKMSVRMRQQRKGFLLTLKYHGAFPGGPFERGEAEIFTSSPVPDPTLLGPEFAAAITAATNGEPLALAYETDIRRLTHQLTSPTSAIELAFDSGHIIAGDAKMPVREIELELKSGDPAELYRLGIELAKNFPVRLGTLAKSDRGFLLLTSSAPPIVRATSPLSGAPTTDEAISALLASCLTQFTANFAAFESGDSTSAIHQMRVALRRLRALAGLFNSTFPCPDFLTFRDQAKHLATAMNEARNLDVLMALIAEGPIKFFQNDEGLTAITATIAARRQGEYEKIKTLLAAPDTTSFVLSTQASLARRAWRNALSPETLALLTAPAQHFARQKIARMHQKILKQGGKNLSLTPHDRHELRIRLKKLRYAADSFAPLFGGKTRAYTRAAANIQDALGTYNDLITARQIVESLPAASSRATGIILGWCARGAAGDEGLIETWRQFRKVRNPFA